MIRQMPCVVHQIKTPKAGLYFAHIQIDDIWADVPCTNDVTAGNASLRITFKEYQGRLQSHMRVVPAVK